MSESEFGERKARAFRGKFPAADGWFVCTPHYMWGMNLLPALLRQKGIAVRDSTWIAVSLHDGPRSTVLNFQDRPFIAKGPGLSDIDWFGTLRFTWRGSPVIVERYWCASPGRTESEITLAAIKDRSAMADLAAALQSFWRKTMGSEKDVYMLGGGGCIPLPKLDWDDLILPGRMSADIRRNVEGFLSARAHYRKLGLPYRRGFLFVGAPGNGKSTAAKIIMASAKAKPLALSLRGAINDNTVEEAFKEASNLSPSILLIEDLDKLLCSKDVSLAYILNLLDGLNTYEGFLLIATSNEPEKLDPALLQRPSRFDRVWQFGLPGPGERRRLLALRGQGRYLEATLSEVAEASAGFTMAMVQEVAVNAGLSALHEGREPGDADLRASAARLKEQYQANHKATGAIQQPAAIGFFGNGNDHNGNGTQA